MRVEENLKILGLFNDAQNDMLKDQVDRMTLQIARLTNDRLVGNVSGGMVRVETGPNSIPIGPYRQDVDATFSLQFNLWIPEYQLKVYSATVHLTPGAIRSSVAVGTSPSGALTSEGGGALTAEATGDTEILIQEHQHKWADYFAEGAVSGAIAEPRSYNTVPGTSLPNNTFDQALTLNTEDAVDLYTGQMAATAGVGVPTTEHTHPVPDHDHEIPSHEHTLDLEIAEGGDATGLNLWIDGINRTAELGGPWDDPVSLQIADYLRNIRGEPVVGAHTIRITSATVGSIEAVGDIYGIIKPPR